MRGCRRLVPRISAARGYDAAVSLVGFYLGLGAVAVVGLVRTWRSQSRSRRYLEAALEEHRPELDHLGPALTQLVTDARALRLSLEGPQRALEAAGRLGAMGTDALELDSELREVSRELGSWLQAIDRLDEAERDRLERATPQARKIAALFREEDYALERHTIKGQRPVRETLDLIGEALAAFERDLQRASDPYR